MKSILDRSFRYVPAVKTDIRETFRRVRAQLATPQGNPPPSSNRSAVVAPIRRSA